jgi:hypothetical protein
MVSARVPSHFKRSLPPHGDLLVSCRQQLVLHIYVHCWNKSATAFMEALILEVRWFRVGYDKNGGPGVA